LIVLVLLSGFFYQIVKDRYFLKKYKPLGNLEEIDGKMMHYHCIGNGHPIVVLDSALGGNCLDWSWIQAEIAKYTKVVAYDRAGYGWSELTGTRRSSETIVEELRKLLQKAKLSPPYILVGHSFGGLNMRLFQQKYPGEVAGMILIDSTPEKLFTDMPNETRKSYFRDRKMLKAAKFLASFGILRLIKMPVGYFQLPENKKVIAKEAGYQTKAYLTAYNEMSSLEKSISQVTTGKGKLDIPLYVISRKKFTGRSLSEDAKVKAEEAWHKLQSNIAEISEKGRHITAENSGHYIHCDEPELVIGLLKEMIAETKLKR
ncbi:alpha/beta hydrolase, partial [Bacillaceae bacterium Marseille-Q3522]|nr:alpha/beta hydrolase [Bacillaceae bacterium Marseille-Q3522]